jgi:hypothetical protein
MRASLQLTIQGTYSCYQDGELLEEGIWGCHAGTA